MIRLWGRTNSLNVQKVLWTLAELGLAYDRSDAGLAFGVVGTPEYLAMNPNGLVPTIEVDGFRLWESNAIVRYLAAKYGSGWLYPEALEERAGAERWMDWQQTTLYPPLVPVFLNLVRFSPEKRDMAAVTANAAEFERRLAIVDRQLAANDYMNGTRFSMADIPIGVTVSRWSRLPLERQSRLNVERWLNLLKERPGFKAHIDVPPS